MIPAAGSLTVRVARRDGAIDLQVTPPAALPAERLFLGRMAAEVAALVPVIWNVCAAAQAAAARSALGLPAGADEGARIAAETLREHVVKLCLVWPGVLGLAPDLRAPGLTARALDDPEAARALRAAIFAPHDRAPAGWAELDAWMTAGRTAPARAFAAVAREWDAGWARAELPLLDPGRPVAWETATQAGRPAENAPACRHPGAPLLAGIAARRGRGPLWRMAARLIEVTRLLDGARPGAGPQGIAPAARGAMMVEAQTRAGRVTAFRRLSPTDFALAPGGVLETALAALPAGADAPLERVARMAIETVDPCVATALEMADA